MKEKLKNQFDEMYWAQTSDLRRADLAKNLPRVSLRAQWPKLFSMQGVNF